MNRTLAVVAASAATAGVFLAGFLFGSARLRAPQPAPASAANAPASEAARQVYTCSMHPQVRLDRPGNCPICEMPLVPANAAESDATGAPTLRLSEHALAMASVETVPVTRRRLARELRSVGKIQYNESSLATVTARVDGYAERLFVNFTGVEISAGDHLAEIYSPELLVAQQELLIAMQGGARGETGPLVEAAKLKLRRWGLTESQIQALVAERKITDRITLFSPISGTVIEKSIVENSAFEAGDALYRVANLDTVWAYVDIYEYDLAWIRYGQRVVLHAEALPGRAFTGMVTFVQPIVSEETRTIRVPVHVENADHALKPGMFVSALIDSSLARDGSAAPTGVEGKFSCPMHPQVLRDAAGQCPVCEMPLELIPGHPAEAGEARDGAHGAGDTERAPRYACPMKCEKEKSYESPGNCPVCGMKLEEEPGESPSSGPSLLAVPISAVLDSGTRRIVYVEKSRGLFEPRAVVVGPRSGEFFPVIEGVAEGERVVARGGFLIDSQFQITGHPSLFYPGGLMAGSSAHQHGGAAPPAAGEPPAPEKAPPGGTAPHKH